MINDVTKKELILAALATAYRDPEAALTEYEATEKAGKSPLAPASDIFLSLVPFVQSAVDLVSALPIKEVLAGTASSVLAERLLHQWRQTSGAPPPVDNEQAERIVAAALAALNKTAKTRKS